MILLFLSFVEERDLGLVLGFRIFRIHRMLCFGVRSLETIRLGMVFARVEIKDSLFVIFDMCLLYESGFLCAEGTSV